MNRYQFDKHKHFMSECDISVIYSSYYEEQCLHYT